MRFRLTALALALAAAGCASTEPTLGGPYRAQPTPPLPSGDVAHVVFLTGNTGDLETPTVLRALAADAAAHGDDATVALLGDLTPRGVPEEGTPGYAEAERVLQATADLLAGLEAEVVVVPGDRDWAYGEAGVRRLEAIVEALFDDDVLTPGDQGGGPREDDPAEGLRLVALDTAWWLLDTARPEGEAEGQSIRTPGDVLRVLDQVLVDRRDDRVVVLAHHPLRARGEHAGYRTVAQSAPTLGLGALAARTFGLSRQDLAAPDYRAMRDALRTVTDGHDRLVWAASHDHSLQTLVEDRLPSKRTVDLVSGTGGGATAPVGRDGVAFAAPVPGYQRLVYYADGGLWAETVRVDPTTGNRLVVFRTEVAGPNPELDDPGVPDDVPEDRLPDTLGETVVTALDAGFSSSERFSNSAFTRALFGARYRDLWKTPVPVPVVDMGTEAGGLTPVRRSGGNQTTGLRLESGDGHAYDFRLLEKGGTGGLPAELRDGLAGDVLLELRAASVPYGAVVAAELSLAAGVPTPRPTIVYIPDDPRLGRYRETFGSRLATLELRPDDDVSETAEFAGFTDVISDESLREELREDQDHRVDQRAFLRARLVDMLVNDWDRHAGQFRWGAFEPGELDPTLEGDAATQGKVYLPVPRDHDWAFYGIGGLIQPALHLFDERLQGIDEDYGSVLGLNRNGLYQDRRFLNELTAADWQAIARDLRGRLSDDVIDRSLAVLPDAIRSQVGPEWRRVLRARRDGLGDLAETYYDLLAGTVDVIGSEEREAFELERRPDGSLEVAVRSFKGGEVGRTLYRRVLDPDETGEVRLYGLGGRDRFTITGGGPAAIAVRVIGGAGRDALDAPAGAVTFYDTPDGLGVERLGGGAEDRRSDAPDVNVYDPTEQVLGDRAYRPVVGYQATDGVIVGATAHVSVPGFRLRPFAATHTVTANVATATGGVEAAYAGRMREALLGSDLAVDALASTPRYVRNFYGFGMGSPAVAGELARVDLARVEARAGLARDVGQGVRVTAGPAVRYADASRDALGPVGRLPASSFDGELHAGAFVEAEVAAVDRAVNPRQGLRLGLGAALHGGVAGAADTYATVGGEARLYVPVGLSPQITLALRAGAERRIGDFPFFDAAVIGGPGSVRGYRRERFAGRSAASAGAEVRAKVLDLSTYLAPVDVGVLAFGDVGRVWADPRGTCGIVSCATHPPFAAATFSGGGLATAVGGGLWFGLHDRAVLNVSAGRSDEGTLLTVGLGFAY